MLRILDRDYKLEFINENDHTAQMKLYFSNWNYHENAVLIAKIFGFDFI